MDKRQKGRDAVDYAKEVGLDGGVEIGRVGVAEGGGEGVACVEGEEVEVAWEGVSIVFWKW